MQTDTMTRYLLTIYQLGGAIHDIRSIQIANALLVSRSCVVKTLKNLAEAGLVDKNPYSTVQLTPEGVRRGNQIYTEFLLFKRFYMECLQMPEEVAAEDAAASVCYLSETAKQRMFQVVLKN